MECCWVNCEPKLTDNTDFTEQRKRWHAFKLPWNQSQSSFPPECRLPVALVADKRVTRQKRKKKAVPALDFKWF